MNKDKFEDFISKQDVVKKEEKTEVDWAQEKKEWLDFVNNFYTTVEGYLENYISSDKVAIRKKPISLNEDYIGKYETNELILDIGNRRVTFTPIGTIIIGAKGRIDMSSSFGTVRFVVVDRNSSSPKVTATLGNVSSVEKTPEEVQKKEFCWKIVGSPPRMAFDDLNEEKFFAALMEVING